MKFRLSLAGALLTIGSLGAWIASAQQPAPGKLADCRGSALAFTFPVDPQQLARDRIQRDRRAARPRGGVDDAVHHERRAFQLVFGPVADAVGLESPRDFEFAEVRRVDLIERRIARALQIRVVMRPFAVLDRKSTRLNSSHIQKSRMPSSA